VGLAGEREDRAQRRQQKQRHREVRNLNWMPGTVAHTCNPSYSGGRDQEDRGSKPAQFNSSRDPILKKTHHQKGLVEWLKVKALSSNPSTKKKRI
jgi:hypothetical protein